MKKQAKFLSILNCCKQKKILCLFFVFFAFAIVFSYCGIKYANAQDVKPNDTFGVSEVEKTVSLGSTDIREIIGKIIRAVLGFLGVIALVLILYAGFTIMTAGGNEEKVTTGKKILVNAVIGLAIILSAMGIVQFILSKLSDATGSGTMDGAGDGTGGTGAIAFQNFEGSGSLGKIIKEHYPKRDQTGVSRNVSVLVTFREAIDPSSIIENTNNTCWGVKDNQPVPVSCSESAKEPYFGDCTAAGVCDKLKSGVILAYKKADANKLQEEMYAQTSYDQNKQAFIFSFKTTNPKGLGDDKNNTWYVVDITNKVIKADGKTPAFQNELSKHYSWEFETSVNYDFIPPVITDIYPAPDQTVARNTIVSITFSEPVDPMSVQGTLKPDGLFYNILFANKNLSGVFTASNGYRTVEFIPSEPCGKNSCGEEMYCIPSFCGSVGCTDSHGILARTAQLKSSNNNSFEALPNTGITDLAGNALDGNKDGKADGKPAIVKNNEISELEKKPDNYYWNFLVKNEIDMSLPYIEKITPTIDEEAVKSNAPLEINFGVPMYLNSLSNAVILEEYAKKGTGIDPIWYFLSSKEENGKTKTVVDHREFGPNNSSFYYFISVSSKAKGMNQNCLYPGKGPIGSNACIYSNNQFQNCAPVNGQSETDTGCITNDSKVPKAQKDINTCKESIKSVIVE